MNFTSLRLRFTLTLFAVSGLVLGLLLWQAQRMQNRAVALAEASDEKVIVDVLGELSRFSLITSEFSDLEHYFDVVRDSPAVLTIVVADAANRIVSSTDARLLGTAFVLPPDDDTTRWRTRSLANAAGAQGLLAVRFSRSERLAAERRTRVWVALVALAGLTAIAGASVVLGSALTRRLAALSLAAGRIGDGDFTVRADIPGSDEVAELGRSLDAMAQKVGAGQERLRASEQRYRLLFDNAADGIFILDLAGNFIDVNETAHSRLGYAKEELLALHISRLDSPEFAAKVPERLAQISRFGRAVFESAHVRKDGTVMPVEVNSRLLDYEGRQVYFSVIRDITERKRARVELRAVEARYRSLVEQIPAITYVSAVSGDYGAQYVSPQIHPLLGFSADEWRADRGLWLAQIHPEDRERVLRELGASQGAGVPFSCEYRLHARDGRLVWVRDEARLVRDEGGSPLFLQGVMYDITGHRRAEEERRKLAAIIENANEFIVLAAPDGRIIYLNPAGRALVGLQPGDDVGTLTMADFPAREDLESWKREILPVYQRQGYWSGEHRLRHFGSGRPIPVDVNSFAVREPSSGRPLALAMIARDATARKNLEAQLLQSQKMEAVGQLAGGVAHDFNNLLTVISGMSELALLQLGAGEPARARIAEVLKAAGRAADLTRQLLAFSRRQVLEPRVLDLNEVVRGLGAMLGRLLGESVRVDARLSPGLRAVKADPGQIEQVLVNLAVNARDAMPGGGTLIVETADAEIDAEQARLLPPLPPGSYVRLEVRDTGTGMPPETLARVFEPFFTTKETGKGTGLGLSTVYGIVKQSGGYVWASSEPGQGTTFTIYLPRADGQATPAAAAPESPRRSSGTVLLVEDDSGVRQTMRQFLEESGYVVLAAAAADEALRLSAGHPATIDILVTDVIMPGASGRELARRLEAQRKGLRVLFVSGYPDEAIAPHGVLDPGLSFLQKPFTMTALADKVRALLDA